MTAHRLVCAATGAPVQPHPDDFCRSCRGTGTVREYSGRGYETITTWCVLCDGTGFVGLTQAPLEVPRNPEDQLLDERAKQ